MLKKMVIIGVVLVAVCIGGCQTMTRDSDQQAQKYSRISELNRRMLAEDIDAILLLDRPSNLTPWHVSNP